MPRKHDVRFGWLSVSIFDNCTTLDAEIEVSRYMRAIHHGLLVAILVVFAIALTCCGHSSSSPAGPPALLVTGGLDKSGALASAELYVPTLGSFVKTGPMHTARVMHTASTLFNGEVIVAGGSNVPFGGPALASAELYEPTTRRFSLTGSLNTARMGHTATVLQDGRILIAGGTDGTNALNSAEIYDPANGTFMSTGAMNIGREYHTATLLEDGRVLIAGGFTTLPNGDTPTENTAELYDPATRMFTLTGNMTIARDGHVAVLLTNGNVLIAGGGDNDGNVLATTEIYDPTAGQFVTGSIDDDLAR